jgi:hypothetical protein
MNSRYVERQLEDGSFIAIDFLQLKTGDKFRMFEGANHSEPVEGGCLWVALADAEVNEGAWCIHCEPVK